MLKLLLKKQLAEIFRNYFYDAKKNRARSKGGILGYVLLFIMMMGILGGMFTMLSVALCGPLSAAGMDWLYFALMGVLTILFGTFGSVFNTFSCLFLSRDNDLMLSLPIPVNALMASRLLTVYLIGVMYSIVVILPAVIVYWIVVSMSAAIVFGCLLLMLLISVFVLTLSCALGWVVAKISLKLKNKSLITVIASLAFFGGYYFFYFKAQTLIRELLANAAEYGAKIRGAAYPLYLFGKVGIGDGGAMLIVSGVMFALFALVWVLISRSFLKIATSSGKTERRVYKEKAVKPRSVSRALLGREFSRFLSSPVYMLNCGLGIVMLPIAGAALAWKGGAILSVLNEVFGAWEGSTMLILCALICVLASMNDMATPSVSLEGKTLWLARSLPVTPWQVLRAKLEMQLLLTGIPVLICFLCLLFIYPYSLPQMLTTVFLLLSYVLFSGLFDLFLGLLTPNLTWTNEMMPIKQSISVVLAMVSGFGYTILLCAGFMLLDGWKLGITGYLALFGGVTLALSALLWLWLRKRGCSRFASL